MDKDQLKRLITAGLACLVHLATVGLLAIRITTKRTSERVNKITHSMPRELVFSLRTKTKTSIFQFRGHPTEQLVSSKPGEIN